MNELLVTGGAGFIGANFLRFWRQERPKDRVTVLDALTYAGRRENLAGVECRFVQGDIRDTALVGRLLAEHDIDTIVHFAAESHVDRSIAEPLAFVETNVLGTASLLQAVKAAWLDRGSGRPHRFHHVSTDEVFGSLDRDVPPSRETDPYAPNSPYSASKAGADHLVRAFHRTYGLEVTTSRCPNNFGPYQDVEKLVPLVIVSALRGFPCPIYGDGMNVRSWLYVEDHCRAVASILERGKAGETYNIAGSVDLPNLHMVDLLCALVDDAFRREPLLARRFPNAPAARGEATTSLKRFVRDRSGHDRRYALDDSKLREHIGQVPVHEFGAALENTVRWYLDHEGWWTTPNSPECCNVLQKHRHEAARPSGAR